MSARLRPWGIYAVVGLAIAVCVVTLTYAGLRIYRLEQQTAYDFGENLVWTMAENENEVLRFVNALERYGRGRTGVTHEDIELRFDLLWSRLNVPRAGEMAPRLQAAGAAAALEAAAQALVDIETDIAALERGDARRAEAVAARLRGLLPDLHQATVRTAHAEIERLHQRSEHRRTALLAALGSLGGLAVGVAALVALLLRELGRRQATLLRAQGAERLARRSEQRFRDIVEAASDWVWETDAEHRFVFLPARLRELSGEDPEEVMGKSRAARRLPEDQDDDNWARHRSLLDRRLAFRDFEFPYRDADGRLRWCRTHGRPVFDADDGFVGYRGTGRDITHEREAKRALDESRALLRAVIDAVPGILNVKDTASRYVLMNRFQGMVYGVEPDQAIDRSAEDFTGETYGGQSRALDQQVIRSGEPLPFMERDFVDAAGKVRTWWATKQPLKDADGKVKFVVTAALDITELKASELARSNLSRYFSPNMVEILAAKAEPIGQIRRQQVAVVFADLFDFTRLSARESPERTMALLRDLHGRLANVVLARGGTLEKFLGDGLMATFGTPVSSGHDAERALECVCDLAATMEGWNAGRTAAGEPALMIGIGAHYGPVILGDIGTERRLEYAVVGDTVNVASRLEALTRRLATRAVVSDALMGAAERETGARSPAAEAFVAGGVQSIDGYDAAIAVWRLDFAALQKLRLEPAAAEPALPRDSA